MFAATLTENYTHGAVCTIVTPFGISTGKVISIDEKEGVFTFQSKQIKPFKMYIDDVLFLSTAGGFVSPK